MNEHTNKQTNVDGGHVIPPELRGVAEALDRLAVMERFAAGDSFEERVAAWTEPLMVKQGETMDALAREERGTASLALEDRIFVATRGLLPAEEPAVAGRIGVQVETRRWRTAYRVAAVAAMAAGAGIFYVASRPGKAPVNGTNGNGVAVASAGDLDDEFADLGRILDVTLGSSETETASATTEDGGEFELPRFDFATSETEGSL